MKKLFEIKLSPMIRGTTIIPNSFELQISLTPYTTVGIQGVVAKFVLDENMTTTIKTLRDMADLLEAKEKEQ